MNKNIKLWVMSVEPGIQTMQEGKKRRIKTLIKTLNYKH
jgi:hypothetical protein